jgi:hypothetical protein
MNHQPLIRARQEANESFSLIQTKDSVGITVLKTEETAGAGQKRTKPVPKGVFKFGTQTYTPS